jgi:glyoxylase-like metal-dependent hydrolase (beta-lactamase superfamily II)
VNDSTLHVDTIVSMPFGQNSYVVSLQGRPDCVVIDPGFEPNKIVDVIERRGLRPAAILNTHGHPDHIAGNGHLKDLWPDCPIVIGRGEASMLTDARLNLSAGMGLPVTSPPADVLVSEGDIYDAAGLQFEVLEIPGHSVGHIAFVCKGRKPYYVFGGDVLFAGSVGRTDFPGGDFEQLATGIHQKLFTLPDDTVVLSGHGEPTTIGEERRSNPFVGENAGMHGLE